MSCDEYLELMSAALDGECSAEDRRRLDGHLAACPHCAALFRALSDQSAALRELDCQPPDGLTRRIMADLPEQKAPGKAVRWRRWGSLAACLALVIAAGVLVPRSMRMNSAAPRSADYSANGLSDPDQFDDALQPERYSTADDDPSAEEPGLSTDAVSASSDDLTKQESYSSPMDPMEPDSRWFSAEQHLRVSYGSTPAAPTARILGSAQSLSRFLEQFPADDLTSLLDVYGEAFFQHGRLLAIVLEEPSGSIGHRIDPQGLLDTSVTVLREIPEACTDDMAAWLILAEVDATFDDGDALDVILSG